MIGIVDYGMGNLGSVRNACCFLGQEVRVIGHPADAASCTGLIVPGVGSFGDCMSSLEATGFAECLLAWAGAGRPLLGICLGLQVLFERSEESPGVPGLGLFKGEVRRFARLEGLKVPQIGWNRVHFTGEGCPLFRGIEDDSFFYFVHGFHVAGEEEDVRAAVTSYGVPYASVAHRGNVMATQFHPEKSHKAGLRMLDNFCALAERRRAVRGG